MNRPSASASASALALAVVAVGCTADPAPSQAEPPPLMPATVEAGYPTVVGPCRAPVAEPSRLVVTSTDFNTGAVGLIDLDTLVVHPDLALASSDAVPVVDGGRVFVINRFGFDWIDELDPDDALALVHEVAIEPASVPTSANPHGLRLAGDHAAWLTLHGAGELQRLRFPTLTAAIPHADVAVDLRAFADADGIPELSLAIDCGDDLTFVSAQRIDRDAWVASDPTLLIPVRTPADGDAATFDFDEDHDGPDGFALLGTGVGPWRLDPDDPSGRTIVLLDSGLERVDLAAGTSSWLVDEAVFAERGMTHLHLSGFDYDGQGRIWLSIADPDYDFGLWLVEPDGEGGAELSVGIEGLKSVTGELEIVGDLALFPDTTTGASGIRVFDLSGDEIVERPESPLPVGLPPMSLAPLD